MRVEDDTSPSRRGRKANIRVVSRGTQQQGSAVLTRSKSDPQSKIPKPQKTGLAQEDVSTNVTVLFWFLENVLNVESATWICLIIRLIVIQFHFIHLAWHCVHGWQFLFGRGGYFVLFLSLPASSVMMYHPTNNIFTGQIGYSSEYVIRNMLI